jgi:hypothetical protein
MSAASWTLTFFFSRGSCIDYLLSTVYQTMLSIVLEYPHLDRDRL